MTQKGKWYEELQDRFEAIMRKHDMPEDIAHELHGFVLAVAQEQYRTGNRSGIAWLRRQISDGGTSAPAMAAA